MRITEYQRRRIIAICNVHSHCSFEVIAEVVEKKVGLKLSDSQIAEIFLESAAQ